MVARGRHADVIKTDGLRLRSLHGNHQVRVPVSVGGAGLAAADIVIVAVKSYDTTSAIAAAGSLIGEDTSVVTFQNGVSGAERVRALLPSGDAGRVLGGAAFIFSHVADHGIVEHVGGPTRFVVGAAHGGPSDRAEGLVAQLTQADVLAEVSMDMPRVLWRKYAFICGIAGVTAATRQPVGAVRASVPGWALAKSLMTEIVALAQHRGVELDSDVVEELLGIAAELPATARSSLSADLLAGRRSELATLHGAAVDMAADSGLEVPVLAAVLGALHPWEEHNRQALSSR